jgi:CheY-like chemotaxis protein
MSKKTFDLKKYFEEHDILIVDKNTGSRSRLMKIMIDLGAKKHKVLTCGYLQEAMEMLGTINLGMVIADFKIGGGSGFDLFQQVRAKKPEKKDLCLVLVTSNISQNAVAKAAEEEVDNFIIKPYTIQMIQESLAKTIKDKMSPSLYMRKIEEGKELLKKRELEQAVEAFREAAKLDPKPALALFYLGHIEYLGQHVSDATANFNKGLTHNSIHYKCLIGLFDLFMELEDYMQAYGIVRKLAKYFPSNPERLSKGIHLAVRTKNFEDITTYYESFKELEERTPQVVNYMGAGLYVAGKYFFKMDKADEALNIFDSIATSCSEYTKFLRAMVEVLVSYDREDVAVKYLSRFTPDTFDSIDYLVADFLISAKVESDPHKVLKKAMKLQDLKVKNNLCHEYLIKAATAAGLSQEKISQFSLEEKFVSGQMQSAV